MVCSVGRCQNIFANNVNITFVILIFGNAYANTHMRPRAPSSCGETVYANHHLNIQGNSAYKFSMDASTYGAGGINTDNSTTAGVTCVDGSVVVNSS